jgi:hypothetical protein
MAKDKPNPPTVSSVGALWTEFKALQQTVRDLKEVVAKLKDVLFTQDNWHSKIVKWIGKDVFFGIDPTEGIQGAGTVGRLLWADRYHIGVAIIDDLYSKGTVREHLINKGHIIHIREA